MIVNRIQAHIFAQLSSQQDMDIEEYLSAFSVKYIGMMRQTLDELTEEEADNWIHKTYVESL